MYGRQIIERCCLSFLGFLALSLSLDAAPISVTYLWHMHQPIYYPYQSVNDIDNSGIFSFSVAGVHNERQPNYTSWPKDAIQLGQDKGLPHAGAQCSFSGSLIENLNGLWGQSTSSGWDDHYDWARNGLRTSLNNPRLDMIGFAYHHSLMPLTCPESRRMQIKLHKEIYAETWDTGGEYTKGFFPPETAFAEVIIPELVAEGLEWVLVDSIHFDRACENYPWNAGGQIYRPNRADTQNPDPGTWIQLNNVWAPTKVSAPFGYQPHQIQYVDPWSDPASPNIQKIVAVPAARYEGNENGRGGYGAFKPQNVWTDTTPNNDPNHPMIMVCHSDGDNFGMNNSDAWHGQHDSFLNMTASNADFENSTVQDYLSRYPVDQNDLIHVESGSWAGADTGDPEFKKWLADPNENSSQNPDRFSWSVLIAAQNHVLHADNLENSYSMNDVRWNVGSDTAKAWHFYLNAEASDYWYWDSDGTNPWNANVTHGCNQANTEANKVIGRHPGVDHVAPSIFSPQREPYNPGGFEFNEPNPSPSDFEVLTYVYDVSDLASVTLFWRTDKDGINPLQSIQNDIYADGNEVNTWHTQAMSGDWIPSVKGPGPVPDPAHRAMTYTSMITGQSEVLIDYFVEAIDTQGNVRRSEIKHVYVGQETGGVGGGNPVTFNPANPEDCDDLTINYDAEGRSLEFAGQTVLNMSFDGGSTWSGHMMTGATPNWSHTIAIPDGSTSAVVYFNDGGVTIDSNDGANWSVNIVECQIPSSASFSPASPDGCVDVTVTYDPGSTGPLSAATNIYIHIGRNGWQDVVTPAPLMNDNGDGTWSYTYSITEGTHTINCVFNDGDAIWDNNNNQDWNVSVENCGLPGGNVIGIAFGSPIILDDPADQNNIGETFDFNTAGGAGTTTTQGGFGSLGEVYLNYDETNFYIGGISLDTAGDNNGVVLFLGFDTLFTDVVNLWNHTGSPAGLDVLHNVAFDTPMDLAILIGDEWGDGTYADFNLGSGDPFGQGLFSLAGNTFTPVSGGKVAQYDGTSSTPTTGTDDDVNRPTDRWEICIPWTALNATGIGDITTCHLAGLIGSNSTNGNDRYLSGNYLAVSASTTNGLDMYNNFGTGFVTVNGLPVDLLLADTDNDNIPDVAESEWGLDPTNSIDGTSDIDGDHSSNADEYRAGTALDDATSLLKVEALVEEIGEQGWQVRWSSVAGKSYHVYRTQNLTNGFSIVASDLVATPPENMWMDPLENSPGPYYYRVGLAE